MSENEERFTPEQLQAIANIKQAMDDTKIIQQGTNGEASSVGIYDEILAERNGEKLEETLDPDEVEAKKMLGRVKFLLSAKIENATRNEDFPPADYARSRAFHSKGQPRSTRPSQAGYRRKYRSPQPRNQPKQSFQCRAL